MYFFHLALILSNPRRRNGLRGAKNNAIEFAGHSRVFSVDLSILCLETIKTLGSSASFIPIDEINASFDKIFEENRNLNGNNDVFVLRELKNCFEKLEALFLGNTNNFETDKAIINQNFKAFIKKHAIDYNDKINEELTKAEREFISIAYIINLEFFKNQDFQSYKKELFETRRNESYAIVMEKTRETINRFKAFQNFRFASKPLIDYFYNLFRYVKNTMYEHEIGDKDSKLKIYDYNTMGNFKNLRTLYEDSIGFLENFDSFDSMIQKIESIYDDFSEKFDHITELEDKIDTMLKEFIDVQDFNGKFCKLVKNNFSRKNINEMMINLYFDFPDIRNLNADQSFFHDDCEKLYKLISDKVKWYNHNIFCDYEIFQIDFLNTSVDNAHIFSIHNLLLKLKIFCFECKRKGFEMISEINCQIHNFLEETIKKLTKSRKSKLQKNLIDDEMFLRRTDAINKLMLILISQIKKIKIDYFTIDQQNCNVIYNFTQEILDFESDVNKNAYLMGIIYNELSFLLEINKSHKKKHIIPNLKSGLEIAKKINEKNYMTWKSSFQNGRMVMNDRNARIKEIFEDFDHVNHCLIHLVADFYSNY